MSVCWATQHSNARLRPDQTRPSRTRIITWLICRQAKWSAHVFYYICAYFLSALATFALKLMADGMMMNQDGVPIARHRQSLRVIECLVIVAAILGNLCTGERPKRVCWSRGPLATRRHGGWEWVWVWKLGDGALEDAQTRRIRALETRLRKSRRSACSPRANAQSSAQRKIDKTACLL